MSDWRQAFRDARKLMDREEAVEIFIADIAAMEIRPDYLAYAEQKIINNLIRRARELRDKEAGK